jgi:hypothetical protein
MRYPAYPKEVNDLLDFAREVRKFHRLYPDEVNPADILQHIADLADGWSLDFLDIVLDQEERIDGLWAKWKRWRNRREFIKRIARPNVTFLGCGRPPEPSKKKKATAKRRR